MTIETVENMGENYVTESRERLAFVEMDLLATQENGTRIDGELINRVFRAVHSIKGGAEFSDLPKIGELAHQTENALVRIRSGKTVPTPHLVRVLLRATGKLRELVEDPGASNQADIAEIMAALAMPRADEHRAYAPGPARRDGGYLRMLLVEDDFTCRLLLQTFLCRYGECHVAVNGAEAVQAFRSTFEQGHRYDLVCMDIMMPEMDGREAVRQVRAIEEAGGIFSTSGATIIMTTTVDDVREVTLCFNELCDAYLMKPIELAKLIGQMKAFELIQ